MERDEQNKNTKNQSKAGAFFKRVFVHNIGWKLLSLGAAILIWVLAAGLW